MNESVRCVILKYKTSVPDMIYNAHGLTEDGRYLEIGYVRESSCHPCNGYAGFREKKIQKNKEAVMRKLEKIPDFKDDREISEFMEAHDGFELVDQGLATIIETPVFSVKNNKRFRIDSETLKLLDELVRAGICSDISNAVSNAVRSYVMTVLPHSYKLLRK